MTEDYEEEREQPFIEKSEMEAVFDNIDRDELDEKKKLKLRDRIKLLRKPDKSFMITMLYNNGTSKTFVITTLKDVFEHKKGMYYIHYDESVYDLTQKQYHLYYQQNFPTPIRREIKEEGNSKWFTVKPENLKPLLRQEYVKTLAEANEISKYLKLSLLIAAIGVLISIANIALLYNYLGR